MMVFKFGGASIETVERAKKIIEILNDYPNQKILVIISAKGKTTNSLEKIVHVHSKGELELARDLLENLRNDHLQYTRELLETSHNPVYDKLNELFTEIEWVFTEPPGKGYDYYYDQIVSIGELLSTSILHAYLLQQKLHCNWQDARNLIFTDDNYRNAELDWEKTSSVIISQIGNAFAENQFIITQGFIGSTSTNNSVTLGREGSDYTAAIFAHILNAESVTIWKDVPSLLNADPKIFPNPTSIPHITFQEVIEMSFYGAQVIHPKTIKPLQNKNIPLLVKCFLDKSLPGTRIDNSQQPIAYPPIMVLKTNQTLLEVRTKDFSFITENNLSKIYDLFHLHKMKINLIQNAAISFVACVDTNPEKIDKLLNDLSTNYLVKRDEDLFLFTVRHYTDEVLLEELKNREVLLSQKTRQTIQIIAK